MYIFSQKCEFSLKKWQLKTLVVFSAIFVADTKIIFRNDFVAPLKKQVKMFFYFIKKQFKMLVFISCLVFFGVYIHIQYFCDMVRNKL